MKRMIAFSFLILATSALTGCSKLNEKWAYVKHLNHKAEVINHYEVTALNLAKKNRELEIKVSELEYEIQKMKTQNSYLSMQLDKNEGKKEEDVGRKIASVAPAGEDLVKQDVYKWNSEQLLATADKEFEEKHYEKAAQFYQTMIVNYPEAKELNEHVLFQAGLASFEAGKHEWTMKTMQSLIKNYPTSKYYRGAKLWMALTNLKLGKKKDFFNTVEEFRKKYRNTHEWTILSAHYENLMQKYKE